MHYIIKLPSHFPELIVLPSSRRHSTCGFGKPVAAHLNRRLSPSCTIIGRDDSGVPEPFCLNLYNENVV